MTVAARFVFLGRCVFEQGVWIGAGQAYMDNHEGQPAKGLVPGVGPRGRPASQRDQFRGRSRAWRSLHSTASVMSSMLLAVGRARVSAAVVRHSQRTTASSPPNKPLSFGVVAKRFERGANRCGPRSGPARALRHQRGSRLGASFVCFARHRRWRALGLNLEILA